MAASASTSSGQRASASTTMKQNAPRAELKSRLKGLGGFRPNSTRLPYSNETALMDDIVEAMLYARLSAPCVNAPTRETPPCRSPTR